MRLSDHIAATCGTDEDVGGLFSNVSAAIKAAERFELSSDVALASYNLTRNKPSSLLSVLPLCRAPYRSIWMEWPGGVTSRHIRPGLPEPSRKALTRNPLIAPDPLKQGVLIETDKSGQRGTMTFCWLHKPREEWTTTTGANVCPLGTLFNWTDDGDVFYDKQSEIARRNPVPEQSKYPSGDLIDMVLTTRYGRRLTDEAAKAWMERSSFQGWAKYAKLASEREALQTLTRHTMQMISPHARGFVDWCGKMALRDGDRLRSFLDNVVHNSWEKDIEGEPPFAETVIAMMNSRNAVEHRDVDLTKLNRSRMRSGKPTFLPYRTTHLRLSQAETRAFHAGAMSREQAGEHKVRGHFKVRKSGIWWWSEFKRGDPTRPIHREEYSVEGVP